jgi:hypothetical protein
VGRIEFHGPTRSHDSSRPQRMSLTKNSIVLLVNASQKFQTPVAEEPEEKTKNNNNNLQFLFFFKKNWVSHKHYRKTGKNVGPIKNVGADILKEVKNVGLPGQGS